MKALVTGTGRCGTVFLAKFLTSAGIPCGHETFFDTQGLNGYVDRIAGTQKAQLSWVSTKERVNGYWHESEEWVNLKEVESDSSYLSAPFLNHYTLANTKIIHVVRNPMKVVNSFINGINYFSSSSPQSPYEEFIYSYLPQLREDMETAERACLYYVLWNELIESKLSNRSYCFHRIEDSKQPVLDYLEVKPTGRLFSDTESNSFAVRGMNKFQVSHLRPSSIKDRFIAIGTRYGYQMSSEYIVI